MTKDKNPKTTTQKSNKTPLFAAGAIASIAVLLVLSLITLSVFTDENNQSYLSRLLDSMNLTQVSTGLDALSVESDNVVSSTILKDGSSSDICSTAWADLELNTDPVWAASGSINQDVRPIAEGYSEANYVTSEFDYNLNLREEVAYAQLALGVKADLVEAKEIGRANFEQKKQEYINQQNDRTLPENQGSFTTEAQSPEDLEDGFYNQYTGEMVFNPTSTLPDSINASARGQAIATVDRGYITLHELNIETDSVKSSNGLTKWYAQDWALDDTQKEGVGELLNIAETMLATDPKDAISEETGNQIISLICDSNSENSVEVGQVGEYEVRIGSTTETVSGRKVTVTPGEVDELYIQSQIAQIAESLAQDEVFREYLYSLYPTYLETDEVMKKINPEIADEPAMSEDEYRAQINQAFADADEQLDEANNESEDLEVYIQVDQSDIIYYLNPDTMNISAFQSATTITLTDKGREMVPAMLLPYLQEGIVSTILVTDIAFNDLVPAIELPSSEDIKPLEQFAEDAQFEDTARQLTNL